MRPEPIEPLPIVNAAVAAETATPNSVPPTTDSAADGSTISTDAASNENITADVVPVTASADDAIMDVVHTRCSTCHAAQPTQQGFAAPPAGIILQTPTDMKTHKAKIVTAVQTGYMPLGNLTKLTDEERQQMVAYASGL